MKICVFSDSHGTAENMIEAVRRETPELCFFLGDGERDLTVLQERFPNLPINTVRGNCDLRSVQPLSLRCAVGGLSIYAVHGHQHEVKYDDMLRELLRAALRANADVVLFGHTHLPLLERRLGMLIINPGTIGKVRKPSYALLTIEDGRAEGEIKYIEKIN